MRYEAPTTVESAVHLLTGPKADDVRILAGGTDLLVQLRSQTRGPGLIV
ncbi:MAG: xanthine dehydrogenase family protein subunit M, partial [bacterium]|nr:xanthine dehydrogenase family protein subunit M [bacterium]